MEPKLNLFFWMSSVVATGMKWMHCRQCRERRHTLSCLSAVHATSDKCTLRTVDQEDVQYITVAMRTVDQI